MNDKMINKASNHQKKNSDILLIVSDVDGTLIHSNGQFSTATIQAIHKIREKGIYFSLGTGRNNNMIRLIAKALDNDLYSITNNGALVMDHRTGKVIYNHTLSENQSKGIFGEIEKCDWKYICYSKRCMYYSGYVHLIDEKLAQVVGDPSNLSNLSDFTYKEVKSYHEIEEINQSYKIGILNIKKDDFEEIQKIASSFGAELKNSGKNFHAIFPKNVSKEVGLQKLQEYLHVSPCNTAVIGDYDNDLPLFSRAAHRIAMGNASAAVLAASTQQTLSNDLDGVAHYLESVLSQL